MVQEGCEGALGGWRALEVRGGWMIGRALKNTERLAKGEVLGEGRENGDLGEGRVLGGMGLAPEGDFELTFRLDWSRISFYCSIDIQRHIRQDRSVKTNCTHVPRTN
jgi:hypothetical protein